jgi:molecular chaperone GrpE (heat shock protein)
MKFDGNLSYSSSLRSLMQSSGISSFKALGRVAQVSDWQIRQLRQGQAERMRVEALHKVAQVLHVPLAQLLKNFSDGYGDFEDAVPDTVADVPDTVSSADTLNAGVVTAHALHLQQEYDRLQIQVDQQRQVLQQEFQQNCLRSLESWLIQFPTLIDAVQKNPQLPAKNFLPFMRPLEQLLQDWGVEAIASVGAEIPYDPQIHQLLEGRAELGDRVRVRYIGYHQGEKLLYRAKVSRVEVSELKP